MHIDKTYRRAYKSSHWECYSCVKLSPACDRCGGYADLPARPQCCVHPTRRKAQSWRIKFRNVRKRTACRSHHTSLGKAIPKLAMSGLSKEMRDGHSVQRAEVQSGWMRVAWHTLRSAGLQDEERRVLLMAYETIVEDGIDILVVVQALAARVPHGRPGSGSGQKIVIARRQLDRSGAGRQGLYAINCYMGTRWGREQAGGPCPYARID